MAIAKFVRPLVARALDMVVLGPHDQSDRIAPATAATVAWITVTLIELSIVSE
jgi:hypothetical protein